VGPFAFVMCIFVGVGGYFGGLAVGQEFWVGVYVGDDVEDADGWEMEGTGSGELGGFGGEKGAAMGEGFGLGMLGDERAEGAGA